jgi:hypothetical protein
MLMERLPASDPAIEEPLGEGLDVGSSEEMEVAAAMRLLYVLIVEGTVNLSAEDRERWDVAGPMRPPRHR